LSAVVPTDWVAVSNEAVDDSEPSRKESALTTVKDAAVLFSVDMANQGDVQAYTFKQSFKISTYLYAIVAGPYTYQEKNTEGFPNMRIYARKSIIGDISFDEMFNVT
jgi:aminopeptidase N